jgi:VWFA-related protein
MRSTRADWPQRSSTCRPRAAQVSQKRDAQTLGDTLNTLRVLADETDGRAIINTNDLDRGLRQIVRDSSAYYLLGYTSSLAKPDGRFHKINVRIKRTRQFRCARGLAISR